MRVALVVAVACLSAGGLCAGLDVQASIKKSTNIPAQELVPALKTLAHERGFQLVFLAEVVGKWHTQGAVGDLTTTEALMRLLEGTNLVYSYLDDKTVTILPVNSNNKLDQQAPSAGNLHRCSGLSSEKLDYATSLNQTGSGSTAIDWSDSADASDCAEIYSSEKQVLANRIASAEDTLVQNSDGESSLNRDSTQASGLEEVIVTAQRREETLQHSSLAIDVLSGEAVQQLSQPTDLNRLAPGVQIANAGPIIQTYVRGVGANVVNARAESAIAYSEDGVYLFTGTAVAPTLFDISRVEVLKGPQGTLYGRNATGGAVNIITNRPELGSVGGYASVEAGNYDLRRVNGALNVPVGDTFAVRAAFQATDRDGYLSDGSNDEVSRLGRIRALWQPSNALSVLLNVEGAHLGGKGPGFGLIPKTGNDAWIGPLDPRAQSALSTALRTPPSVDNDSWAASSEMNWDWDFAKLTVLPGYRHEDNSYLTYTGGFLYATHAVIGTDSFEARLSHEARRLKWVVGGYYLNVDQRFDTHNDTFLPRPLGLGSQLDLHIPGQGLRSWAAFGESTFSVVERLRMIGGLRFTHETQSGSGRSERIDYPNTAPTAASSYDFSADLADHALTWKGGIEFDAAPQSLLFFTVSEGFKGRGWNPALRGSATNTNEFKSEKLTAYEVGSRNRFFDRKLQVNLEGFYWRYKDHQETYTGIDPGSGQAGLFTLNSGAATMYGADLDMLWQPTASDSFHAGVEYLHARYDEFVRTSLNVLAVPDATVGCPVADYVRYAGGAPARVHVDCSGLQMQRSPRWSGSASYEHRFDLPNGGDVTVGAAATFSSSKYLSIEFLPLEKNDSYVLADADVAYNAADHRWVLTAYVHNITQKPTYSGGGLSVTYPAVPYFLATIGAPRTYGVRLRINFDRAR